MKRCVVFLIVLLCVAGAAQAAGSVYVLHLEGQIDPPMAAYIKDGINAASDAGAQAVLIVVNTPGGSMTCMEQIVTAFFASKIPVIVWVGPNGAKDASAGLIVTMAADIAAAVPVSSIGSASPVSGAPGGSSEIEPTMKRKVENNAVSYVRSIAKARGRNADWAEKAVRVAANLPAPDALKQHVIDYIASDPGELMRKIDGRKIHLTTGKTLALHTANAPFTEYPMGAWDTFLHYLCDPMVALFLSMAAMYGIIYEIASPGAILPGVIGGISVLLLLYSFSVIPFSAAGLAFIVFAIALFVVDVYSPTHGILTVGGIISLFFGLMMMFRVREGFMVSTWVLAFTAILTGGFFLFVIGMGLRARRKPYIAGREGVVGHIGEARTDLDPKGQVFVNGALWSATSESGPIAKGEQVEIVSMSGLRLTVRRRVGS